MWFFLDPLVMALIGLLLLEAMAFVALWLPFGIVTVAQLVRAASSPGREGLPTVEHPGGNMRRWHVVAVCLVTSAAIASGIQYALGPDTALDDVDLAVAPGQFVDFALIKVSLWIASASLIFSFLYLGRLVQHGVPYAEILWFGVCVIPATMFALSTYASAANHGGAVSLGAAGCVSYILAVLMPRGKLKVAVWAVSCGAIAMSVSDFVGPWNPVWLFLVIAAGYATYRLEWKSMSRADSASTRTASKDDSGSCAQGNSTSRGKTAAKTRRAVAFMSVLAVGAVALVLVARVGPVLDGAVPAVLVALLSLTIAAIGAGAASVVTTAIGVRGSRVADAATMFVVLLAVASVIHLAVAPGAQGSVFGASGSAQFWKLVLGVFATVGAAVIAYTTLTGKACQVRPFMVATVLPAAYLLPSAELIVYIPEDAAVAWLQRAIEAGITLGMLSLMWYALGPGRMQRRTEEYDPPRGIDAEAVASF